MAEYNGLPLYEANIDMNDEETGMFVISLVDYPATCSNFLAFSKERLTYEIQDEEQRKVFGLVMGANLPIYRRNPDGYEYFIVYSRETIAKMAEKYFKMGLNNNVDTMHDFELEEGITMTQMYIKDSEKGVSPKGFEEFEDGSLFAEFHVENDEVWNGIKEGTYRGFSLAGVFEVSEPKVEDNKQSIKNSIQMKLEKIKEALRKLLVEFGTIATDKGTLVWDGEDEIKEGDAVHSVDENGNDVPVEDGDYTTEDKRIISIEGGKVVAIKETEVEEPIEEEPKEEETPIETEEEPKENEEKEEEEGEEPKEDEKDAKIKELEDKIKELEAAIEEKDAKIKELEGKSAAKSAEEEFKETKSNLSPKAEALQKKGYRW